MIGTKQVDLSLIFDLKLAVDYDVEPRDNGDRWTPPGGGSVTDLKTRVLAVEVRDEDGDLYAIGPELNRKLCEALAPLVDDLELVRGMLSGPIEADHAKEVVR